MLIVWNIISFIFTIWNDKNLQVADGIRHNKYPELTHVFLRQEVLSDSSFFNAYSTHIIWNILSENIVLWKKFS